MDFLYTYLSDDLARIGHVLDAVFQVEGDLMQEVADYLSTMRGKMLRPCLVSLAARAYGLDPTATDHHINLGAAIELFHVATLLHDDVIDKAPERRGRSTVNEKWGDDAAILFADYLYATSFDLALSTLKPETLRVLSQTTQRMTEGEFLQIERRGQWLAVDDYMNIITRKTAQLFAASACLGALIAGADRDAVTRMAEFGLEFGLAFQITDDTLDYEAQTDKWGKRVGADLAEGKQTLPLLHTLKVASPEDREALIHVLNNGRDFDTVHRYVVKYNAIGSSLDVAAEHCKRALAALDDFSADNKPVGLMRQIADQVIVRQY